MSKITFLVGVLISVLLFSAVTMPLFVNLASADVTIYPWDVVTNAPPVISINSPSNYTIFYGNLLPLNFTATASKGWAIGGSGGQALEGVGYVLDGKSYGPFTTYSNLASPLNFCINLTLGQGLHILKVYGNASGWAIGISERELSVTGWSDTVYFTTLPIRPTVDVQPLIINGTSLLLNFTLDEPVSRITYSIDNQDNISIAGNTTLTNLPYGHNNITVYATNPAGNVGASQTIDFFTIAKPEPFPTTTVIVAAVSAVVAMVVVAGLLVYHKKHKH